MRHNELDFGRGFTFHCGGFELKLCLFYLLKLTETKTQQTNKQTKQTSKAKQQEMFI